MTVTEAALLIEAINQIAAYEKKHGTEVWRGFYDFAENMLPVVEAGMLALKSNMSDPWEDAYAAMDREIEKVFGIKLKEESK